MAIPKLLNRLINANYEEAAQLFDNRLCELVTLMSPPADEISELFEKRAIKFSDSDLERSSTTRLAGEAKYLGNWRFVIQVARECRSRANGSLTQKQFDAALSTARDRRIKQ